MPMPPVAVADSDSGSHIHGRKQRRDSMALVVMRLPGRHAGSQRQNRLRSIQRLDLTLLIHAQHDRTIRRIHIQPHDVPHLFHELRVFGELEILDAVRLQSERMPDAHDRRLREPGFLRHQPAAPVRAVFWHRLQRLGDHLFDLCVGNRSGSPQPRLVQQTFQPTHPKALPPFANRSSGDLQFLRHSAITQSFITPQHDACAHRDGLRGFRTTRQHRQFFPLLRGQVEWFGGASDGHTQVCARLRIVIQRISNSGH